MKVWLVVYVLACATCLGILLLIHNLESTKLIWWYAWIASVGLSWYIANTVDKWKNG